MAHEVAWSDEGVPWEHFGIYAGTAHAWCGMTIPRQLREHVTAAMSLNRDGQYDKLIEVFDMVRHRSS